jgi:hypothetical protein
MTIRKSIAPDRATFASRNEHFDETLFSCASISECAHEPFRVGFGMNEMVRNPTERRAEPFLKFWIPSDFVLYWGRLDCHPTSLDNSTIVTFCIATIIGLTNLGLPESVDRDCRSCLNWMYKSIVR